MYRPTLHALSITLLTLAAVPAQSVVVPNNALDSIVRMTGSNSRGLAVATDGSLWTMYYRQDIAGARSLNLTSSTDAGKTWKKSAKGVITAKAGELGSLSAITIDRACDILHVGYTAKSSASATVYWSAYYRQFDLAKGDWIGAAQEVAIGWSRTQQFYLHDIAVTEQGTLVLAITGNSGTGGGLSYWDGGLLVKKPGKAFPKVDKTNAGLLSYTASRRSGITPNLQVVGEVVHVAFRATTGAYGPHYSQFDTTTMKYTVKGLPVAPNNNGTINGAKPVGGGNLHNMLVDRAGGKYILWVAGTQNCNNPTKQGLRLAYAPPGKGKLNADWTDTQIFFDAATKIKCPAPGTNQVKGGNSTERFYALANASDNVFIVYSKPEDKFQTLYYDLFKSGKKVLPITIKLATSTTANAFEWVTGFRNNEVEGGGMVLTWGERDQTATPKRSGVVKFYRVSTRGRTVSYGTACQGSLKQAPRLRTDVGPSINGPIKVIMDRHPAGAMVALALGVKCQTFSLAPMGAPGCWMFTDFPILSFFNVNAQGSLTLPFTVPNDTKLLDVGVNLQNFVFAPGANPAGAVTSNAISVRF